MDIPIVSCCSKIIVANFANRATLPVPSSYSRLRHWRRHCSVLHMGRLVGVWSACFGKSNIPFQKSWMCGEWKGQ